MKALVIAEHDDAGITSATLSAVTAARSCAAEVHLLLAGLGVDAIATAAAGIDGVSKVLLADNPAMENSLAETMAAQISQVAMHYSHIVFGATAAGKSVAPRVAALLDVAQISDVIAIDAPDTFQRPIYAGNAIATMQALDAIKVLTIRATAFAAATCNGQAAAIEFMAAVPDSGMSRFVGRETVRSDRPDLAGARVVVSGGRGMGSEASFQQVLAPLADRLGAALGASRAAVDAGYAPNNWQVGQTGKIVAPELYVAVGISGAIQHLAGMKDSKYIVAVNKDAEAPIFGLADYGLQADLFEAVPELAGKL